MRGPATTTTQRPANRTTALSEGLVVFHIGMTITKPHRPDLWGPVFAAMPRMLRELYAAKSAHERDEGEDPGFLGTQTLIGRGGPFVVPPGGVETFYGNGAELGLGAMIGTQEVTSRGRTAAQRLAGEHAADGVGAASRG
ncbi:DUF4188 domain-containing protein [Brachybacterium sp. J144]|uniref:monooxygenase family protein n=1 Tax=Brachybacterium sp. J144 TaxID=3116487 RepID=UPI002E769678|nr:DUF4188 domain-containing protein [Brachybacterium sp. J144]MEE1650675.1 DUF4188 domain-containing protein [Brachybacterium sp. J144]